MERQRNQKPSEEHEEVEEIQHGPFPVEQLQVSPRIRVFKPLFVDRSITKFLTNLEFEIKLLLFHFVCNRGIKLFAFEFIYIALSESRWVLGCGIIISE